MPYIFGKLWHLAIIWDIRKAFQCILQGVRILLANHTRISPTSDSDSYLTKLSCYDFKKCQTNTYFQKLIHHRPIRQISLLWLVDISHSGINTKQNTYDKKIFASTSSNRVSWICRAINCFLLNWAKTHPIHFNVTDSLANHLFNIKAYMCNSQLANTF